MMGATAGMRCLLVIVMSQVALAAPGKEVNSTATGCVIPGNSLDCTGGVCLLSQVREAAPGTECYDVITMSSVRCEEDGNWTQQAIADTNAHVTCVIFGNTQLTKKDPTLQIHCPGNLRSVAQKLQTTSSVTWEDPPTSGANVSTKYPVCSPKSGSIFSEGHNDVQCSVEDDKGQLATCAFSVTVEVRKCLAMTWPDDGEVSCSHDSLWGSTCTLTCDPGFRSLGPNTTECTGSDWSVQKFRCEAIKCEQLPTVSNGHIKCTAIPVYGSSCQLTCDEGFRLRGTPTVFCQEDGTFTAPGQCEDDESPAFLEGCPSDIEDFAAPLDDLTLVSWTAPQVKDNSGSYNLTCSHDVSQGFAPGRHTVVYTATDAANNMATCSFQVFIKTISCGVPSFDKSGKDLMMYSCPEGYVLGAQCKVSCKSGYPQVGPDTLFCDKDDSALPPTGVWSTRKTINPECRVTPCPSLLPPKNGALACDQWGHGQICSIQCNENYDIPLQALQIGEFVCGASTGTWRPTDKVPDCIEKRLPDSIRLPGTLHYTTGYCPDHSIRKEIKDNLTEVLKKPKYTLNCSKGSRCRLENVLVKCGPVSARRRKRRVSNVSADFEIEVDFSIAATLPSGQNGIQAELLEKVRKRVGKKLSRDVAAGAFDLRVDGLDLKVDHFDPGSPSFVCKEGTKLSLGHTCAGCSPGTFFNASVNDCQDCPVGSYAEAGSATTCTPCPAHTSTMGTGKSSINQCLAQCRPGWVSDTGLEPCQQCPVGSFQTEWGHTLCSQCPFLSSTTTPGATSPDQCLEVNGCDAYSPCGNHSCVSVSGGWQCQCHGGWSGSNCSTPPDLCLQHQCQNGASCVNGLHNYSCLCERGFKGELCNVVIRDGGWSEWSDWTECSATCGGGSSSRQRSCDSPSPDPDGLPCVGPSVESRSCHPQPCPSCPPLPEGTGVVWNCTQEEEMTSCTLECQEGLVLAKPLPVYQCGRATNYTWPLEETAEDFVPECTEPLTPVETHVRIDANLGLDCQTAVSIGNHSLQGLHTATLDLDCVINGLCRVGLALSACPTSDPGNAGVISVNVTLEIVAEFSAGRVNLTADVSKSTDPSLDPTRRYLELLTSLARTLEQVRSDPSAYLTVRVGSQQYPPSTPSLSGNVTCPSGSVPAQVACGPCPRGTYQSGVQCVLCGRGSYADSTGSTSCTDCPPGLSTPGLGSSSSSQCRPGGPFAPSNLVGGSSARTMLREAANALHIAVPVALSFGAVMAVVGVIIIVVYNLRLKRKVGCCDTSVNAGRGRGSKYAVDSSSAPPPTYQEATSGDLTFEGSKEKGNVSNAVV